MVFNSQSVIVALACSAHFGLATLSGSRLGRPSSDNVSPPTSEEALLDFLLGDEKESAQEERLPVLAASRLSSYTNKPDFSQQGILQTPPLSGLAQANAVKPGNMPTAQTRSPLGNLSGGRSTQSLPFAPQATAEENRQPRFSDDILWAYEGLSQTTACPTSAVISTIGPIGSEQGNLPKASPQPTSSSGGQNRRPRGPVQYYSDGHRTPARANRPANLRSDIAWAHDAILKTPTMSGASLARPDARKTESTQMSSLRLRTAFGDLSLNGNTQSARPAAEAKRVFASPPRAAFRNLNRENTYRLENESVLDDSFFELVSGCLRTSGVNWAAKEIKDVVTPKMSRRAAVQQSTSTPSPFLSSEQEEMLQITAEVVGRQIWVGQRWGMESRIFKPSSQSFGYIYYSKD